MSVRQGCQPDEATSLVVKSNLTVSTIFTIFWICTERNSPLMFITNNPDELIPRLEYLLYVTTDEQVFTGLYSIHLPLCGDVMGVFGSLA